MILTINEIKERIFPVAEKYGLRAVYLFGSYARQEARDDSDVDILIDRTNSSVKSMFDMGGLYNDLQAAVGKSVDLVTTQTLEQKSTLSRTPWFAENLNGEKVKIYE